MVTVAACAETAIRGAARQAAASLIAVRWNFTFMKLPHLFWVLKRRRGGIARQRIPIEALVQSIA
jgi:hypothetical protein